MSTKVKRALTKSFAASDEEHSEFGASSSERWIECPGSVQLSRKAPPEAESKYAKEGTLAHAALEFMASNRKVAGAVVMARKQYPEAMIIHAEMALKVLDEELKDCPDAEVVIEERVSLPVKHEGQGGTVDIGIVEEFGWLKVIDYKYGAGIPVPAEENTQLIYYALGLAAKYDYNFGRVRIMIVQPRAQIDGEYVRTWDTDIDTLLAWRDRFEKAITIAKGKNPPFKAGDHCRFCRAAIICTEVKNKGLRAAQLDFDDETGVAVVPTNLNAIVADPKKLAKFLDAIPKARLWLNSVEEFAFEAARKGTKIPGYKLVPKRGKRHWLDMPVEQIEKAARRHAGEAAFTKPELKSPAQVEKLGGKRVKQFVKEWSTNISSGLTLVSESDKRPETTSAKADFEDDHEW